MMSVVLIALTSPLRASSALSADARPYRVLLGSRKSDAGDAEYLRVFSKILLGLDKDATFETLYERLPVQWSEDERYDTVNPFGDKRDHDYGALWTCDTRSDVLQYTNANSRSRIPLSVLREHPVNLTDMESLGGPVPSPSECTFASNALSWHPEVEVDDRIRAFIHPLLRDFNHQWRHVLRNDYNSLTLRKLVRAIVRISTLDFEVKENLGGYGPLGVHVWITHLPAWEPFEADIVRVGTACLVICQDLRDGLSMVEQHAASQKGKTVDSKSTVDLREAHGLYIIFSVKFIMLCHATGPGSLKHTAPQPLFNGDYGRGPPSDTALNYLIWATASARPSSLTCLHSLPIEVQDRILRYTSSGTVLAAQIGCSLGLGSVYLWNDGPWENRLEERHLVLPKGYTVESQIWFDEHKSGVVYLANPKRS